MRLQDALADLAIVDTARLDPEREFSAATNDSRAAGPGTIFVAIPGFKRDGAAFIPDVIAAGCDIIVAERIPDELAPGVTYLAVESARAALAPLARAAAGRPDERMRMIGVTGTNGKTSVVHLVAEILRLADRRVGVLGTLGFDMAGELIPTKNTTPEAPILHELLRRGVEAGLDDVVMEVSSHALELHRVDGIGYDVAMFTNLTEDHLEVHGTMERYYEAKARLFELAAEGVAVIQIDDEYGRRLAAERDAAGSKVLRVTAAGQPADVAGEDIEARLDGTDFDLVVDGDRRRVRLQAIGGFNVNNAVVAAACGLACGIDLDTIVEGLEATPPVVGRMERVVNDEGLDVIVDSAHTPDALVACLDSLRELTDKPITLVHGVLSDRNPELLAELERAASAHADHIIYTESDMKVGNLAQVLEIVTPVLDAGPASWEFVENRWAAIGAGVERARRGDVVVIAGKGDERQMYLPDDAGAIPINEPEAAAYAIRGGDPLDLDPRRV